NFNYPTVVLSTLVREYEFLALEEAIRLLTQRPARLYGLKDRGVIAQGAIADVVIFDAATVGTDNLATRADLPATAERPHAAAAGIEFVLVAGDPVVEGRSFTGARPGRVLRSGRDTVTPSLV